MDAYQLALAQGRKELAGAQQSLKALSLRVSQLESIVTQLEALTAGDGPSKPPSNSADLFESPKPAITVVPAAIPADVPVTQPPLWKAIINALNGKKADFTVPEAIAALERTGRRMESRNRNNIVRNTLIQNKAFGRLSPGHYYVRGFEIEFREEKTEEALRVAS